MKASNHNGNHCNKKRERLGLLISGFVNFFIIFVVCAVSNAELIREGDIDLDERWTLADSPVSIQDDLTIARDVTVTIEAGVEIRIARDAVITVLGRLDGLGTVESTILFHPAGEERWGAVSYEGSGSGELTHCVFNRGSNMSGNRTGVVNAYRCSAPVVIDSCTFTQWPDDFNAKATQGYDATQMVVRRCYFGPGENEAVHGDNSPILVEYNTFDLRFGYNDAVDIGTTQNPGPVIRYNTFLGGDDDGIDLDDCDAYVEGNLVMNFRGGSHDPIGISGDRTSKPVIVNNVVINCENGIGFKNGAQITVINNTIIDCDRGIWMHQNPAHALVYNTIIWGGRQSIKLEPGSTIDISYSIIQGASVYPGEANSHLDPLFADPVNQVFSLLAGSPAIDAGWEGTGVLEYDFLGLARLNAIDIGAFEFQGNVTGVWGWGNL